MLHLPHENSCYSLRIPLIVNTTFPTFFQVLQWVWKLVLTGSVSVSYRVFFHLFNCLKSMTFHGVFQRCIGKKKRKRKKCPQGLNKETMVAKERQLSHVSFQILNFLVVSRHENRLDVESFSVDVLPLIWNSGTTCDIEWA